MQDKNCQLRALVATCDGGIQARLVELEIAAFGKDVNELLKELGHAITVAYRVAKEFGETPFVKFMKEDNKDADLWDSLSSQNPSSPLGSIAVPSEVGEALAAFLRLLTPIRLIQFYQVEKKLAA
jgi:hypothetical protein